MGFLANRAFLFTTQLYFTMLRSSAEHSRRDTGIEERDLLGRTIAIGDIHGCATALETLIEKLAPTEADCVITLGDYVDRGPESRRVVDLLLDLETRCELIALLGNHELLMLRSMEHPTAHMLWMQVGGVQTLDSYGGSLDKMPPEHLEFFHRLVPYHETDEFLFLHANYNPELPLNEQTEESLFWKHVSRDFPARHSSGKTAFVGHTPQKSGQVGIHDHIICVDTGCFANQWLTGIDVHSLAYWQSNQQGELRESSSQTRTS
ncbi:MAG: serine/threonine protein phosphatase 1 [Pirellulaceae bacterium]|jgi:serine/threonine protein phosphatase 1